MSFQKYCESGCCAYLGVSIKSADVMWCVSLCRCGLHAAKSRLIRMLSSGGWQGVVTLGGVVPVWKTDEDVVYWICSITEYVINVSYLAGISCTYNIFLKASCRTIVMGTCTTPPAHSPYWPRRGTNPKYISPAVSRNRKLYIHRHSQTYVLRPWRWWKHVLPKRR
jgi:hypothetical protein